MKIFEFVSGCAQDYCYLFGEEISCMIIGVFGIFVIIGTLIAILMIVRNIYNTGDESVQKALQKAIVFGDNTNPWENDESLEDNPKSI